MVFGTIMKMRRIGGIAAKPKPKMKPIELKTPFEQTLTISRAIFNVVKEHGPLTIAQTWDRVQGVGLKQLTSKTQMKMVLRWMKERQNLRLICNRVGSQKQFLYTTWFTNTEMRQEQPTRRTSEKQNTTCFTSTKMSQEQPTRRTSGKQNTTWFTNTKLSQEQPTRRTSDKQNTTWFTNTK